MKRSPPSLPRRRARIAAAARATAATAAEYWPALTERCGGAGVTSASENSAAAVSASADVANTPNAVGPEPLIRAASAPASWSFASVRASSGRRLSAAASRSFSMARASAASGARERATPLWVESSCGWTGSGRPRRRPSPSRALVPRDEHERHVGQLDRLDALARARDERVARLDLARHVRADAACRSRAGRRSSSGSPARRLAARSTAAASALPPPSPAATGMRLSIVTRSSGGCGARCRALGAEGRRAPPWRGSGR